MMENAKRVLNGVCVEEIHGIFLLSKLSTSKFFQFINLKMPIKGY